MDQRRTTEILEQINVRAALLIASVCMFACFGLDVSLCFAQSNTRSPMPPPPVKQRAPDISTVSNNIDRDDSNQIVDVIFKGNRQIPTHHLTRNIGTRPGRYFDPDLLQQDVDRLWRMPEIRRLNGPYIERTPEGLVITIDVVERNQVREVKFIGNRGLADRTLKKETGLEDGKPLDLQEIRMAKTRIEELYRQKGYPRTQVEIIEGDKIEDGQVVFMIYEDQKQKVWKAEFVGNTFATDARLKHFIKSKPAILKLVGGVVNREEIDQDVLRLESYYKSFGFFNARIGRELVESDDGRWISIRFIIDEGPRYKVRNVSFIGNQSVATPDLQSLTELKPDENGYPDFNVGKMNQDVVSLRDLYGSQGYVHVSVDAEPRFLEEPGILDIVYRIEEGQRYRVGKINVHIEGDYGITKREPVLNRVSLRPGQWVDVREIRNSERRLGSASIFATGGPDSGGAAPRIVVRPSENNEIERTADGAGMTGGAMSTRHR